MGRARCALDGLSTHPVKGLLAMQPNIKTTPWVAVVPTGQSAVRNGNYCGDGRDILLQGFHWESHRGAQVGNTHKCWYRILTECAPAIQAAGFTWVWFPPASDSLAPQGYIPRRWNCLETSYGNEAELRSAIASLGPVGALADVVLNHRVGVHTSGADFADPEFPDNRAAITRDDESGVGTGNWDTGESHPAGRDLDHSNPDVRNTIKAYLQRLRALGFQGWRYDLVKGYHGKFIAEYNEATQPGFSVGEFYDGDRQKVTAWLDSAQGKSTAFDFPTRYMLYDACMADDFARLRTHHNGRSVPGGLLGFWPSRSVTFLDNHDTEHRRDREHEQHGDGTRHFPGNKVQTGYAYTLTHPGTPCVFWAHFFDWGTPTRRLIETLLKLRKAHGIHSRSGVEIREARRGLYAAVIDGRIAVKLGSAGWWPGQQWQLVADGERFAVWERQ
jgi:alpha-amylase